jgi:hypothetical protein
MFVVTAFVGLALAPVPVFAQADTTGITGSVRDTSGAVLPGVTIEASSPALIERSRTVVSDDNGLYRIVDLRPGTYTVTFTLTGFNTTRRDGIELAAGFTAPVNVVMAVGALEETITVSGAAPVVDVSNVATRTPLSRQVLEGIPSARNVTALGALIPGANPRGPGSGGAGGSDVGGSNGLSKQYLRYHGLGDTVTLIDGMRSNAPSGGEGDNSQYYWGGTMVEELSYVTSDGSAEAAQGGLRLSVIPKEGGNAFHGTVFFNYTNDSLNSDNFGDLAERNLVRQGLGYIKRIWDFNPAIGGPIKRDKLWFFYAYRHWGVDKTVNNCFDARTGLQCSDPVYIQSAPGMTRLTWQMTPKFKLVSYFDKQSKKQKNYGLTALIPEDASGRQITRYNYVGTVKMTASLTNRLLLEVGTSNSNLVYLNTYKADTPTNLLSQQELSTSVWSVTWNNGDRRMHWNLWSSLASISYVTGSHAFKTGMSLTSGTNDTRTLFNGDVTLQTRNGVYVGAVLRNSPSNAVSLLDADLGLFVQDQWTAGRATITGGLRFDSFIGRVPEQFSPAGTWVPERSYPEIRDVPNWKDISPRVGIAYDVFGNGKTGFKAYAGRYAIGGGNTNFTGQANPFTASGAATDTRSWTDVNGDRVPQLNELGPSSNSNFGRAFVPQAVDDSVRTGWHVRRYLWQYNFSFSQQVLPRVAVDVGYHYNTWGNYTRSVNILRSLSDYTPFTIVNPRDGSTIQMYDVLPARRPLSNNVVNFVDGAKQTYSGFDVTLNSRLPNGVLLQGGVAMGRVATHGVVTDDPNNCEGPFYGASRFCDLVPPFRPEVKFVSSYPLPWQFVANAALQVVPGPEVRALYNVTSAIALPTLRRNLSGSAIGVDLIPRYTEFGDTLTQLDVRLARNFMLGRTKLQGQFDIYNLTNSNAVATEFTTWGPRWREPQDVTVGRLIKFGMQVDF